MLQPLNDTACRLLLVEDNPEQRQYYREILEHQQAGTYHFLEAELGEDGLDLCRRQRPDCVLLDYRLPDMDGLEFLMALADDRGRVDVPVIMLTSQGDERVAVEAMKRGATDYLSKSRLDSNRLGLSIAQAVRQKQEEHFRSLLDSAPDAMIVTNLDGHIVLVNAQTERLFGYARKALLGQPATMLLAEPARHDAGFFTDPDLQVAGAGLESLGVHRAGNTFPVEISFRPLQLRGETLISSAVRDITERKAAEAALRRSEARNRALLNAIPDAMVHLARDGTYLDVHLPGPYRAITAADKLIGATPYDTLPAHVADRAMACLRATIETGELQQFEYEVEVDGQVRVREARIVRYGEHEAISIQRDITQRTQAERNLRESERRFRELFERSPDAVFVEDLDGYVLDGNPAAYHLHGLTHDALVGRHMLDFVPPDRLAQARQTFAALVDGTREMAEGVSLTTDGRRIQVEIRCSRITYAGQEALLLHVRDITARKAAEAEIRRLKAFYQQVLDDLPADVAVMEPNGRILYLNRTSVGDPTLRKWLIGRTGLDYCRHRNLDPALAERRQAYVEQAVQDRRIVSFEESIPRADGSCRHILRMASPVMSTDGEVTQVIGYGLDITARKEAEKALRKSEAMLRTIVSNIPVILFVLNREGHFTLAEGKGLSVFGVQPGEPVGRSAYSFFRDHQTVQRDLDRALRGEAFSTVTEVRARAFECWYAPFLDADGAVEGTIGVAADITEMVRSKEALAHSREELRRLTTHLQQVREEERTRLSREVHDVLGQAMTALRMDVMWIEQGLPDKAPETAARIETMKHQIDETIHTIRRIASDLRPSILDDLGVAVAIDWEARQFEARTGIGCIVHDLDPDLWLDAERSTALFRIFQEILTNVARHAQATRIDITLTQHDDVVSLKVKDNGRGIRDEDLRQTKSLGLLGMRERVLPWNGDLHFAGVPGHGTTVSVTLPV